MVEGWSISRLDALSTMKSGVSITEARIEYSGNYPCYGGNGLRGFTADYTHDGKYALVGRQGALCGNVILVSGKFFASEHAIVVTPKPNTDIAYLSYVLKDMQLNQYSESSAQPGLSVKKVLEIETLAPPLPEQRLIAAALSDADTYIASLEKLLAKKRAVKQGAMQELLTGKRRLPGFSGEWGEKALYQIADDIIMGQSPDSRYYNTARIGAPLVQGNADIENKRTIIRFFTSVITKHGNKGDIILTVRAPVGNVAKADFDCCLGRGVCAIKGSDFLYHLLVYFEPKWGAISTGSTFDSISGNELREVIFAVPLNATEQTAIAALLSDMDAEIDALTAKLNKAKRIKQGMMSELLTGRIRLITEVKPQ
jgi:type I restriction enzyme S subunit